MTKPPGISLSQSAKVIQRQTETKYTMETNQIFDKMDSEMQKSVDHVLHEFSTLHTGKANTSMVENITVGRLRFQYETS